MREEIVVLDGHCLNPGDLNWQPLKDIAPTTIYSRTRANEIIPRAQSATILITNKCRIDKSVIDALPLLKYIGVLATGTDNIDVGYARDKGIQVCNACNYSTSSVAQHVFAFILALSTGLIENTNFVKNGEWAQSPDFSASQTIVTELKGKTLGLIGLGNIGKKVAAIGHAFDMKVSYFKPQPAIDTPDYINYQAFTPLVESSDIISIHCPLTSSTQTLFNASVFAIMKPGSLLINTSRGGVIDEKDLAYALKHGPLRAAGLDVLTQEPPRDMQFLTELPNCLITPHTAWASQSARQRLLQITVENLKTFLKKIHNQV